MACCLAVALVIAVLRAGWYRLVPGRRPARPGFAPPARRPAPGTVPDAVPPAAATSVDPVGRSVVPPARPDEPVPTRSVPPRSVPARGRVGFALVVAGAGWTVMSGIAMQLPASATQHLGHHTAVPGLGAVDLTTHGFGLAGLLMHGPGLVAIALGVLLVLSASARGVVSRGTAVHGAVSHRQSHRPLTTRPGRAT